MKSRCSGTMTEAQFLAWVRSALRSKSLKWKPRNDAIMLARREYKGDNKQQRWEVKCAICQNWFKLKDIHVDHYPKEAGSILSVDDIGNFCNNLFCEVDNLRCLCSDCHKAHTYASAKGISFEEAMLEKKIIKMLKKENLKQTIDFIKSKGYTNSQISNAKKRREVLRDILKGE